MHELAERVLGHIRREELLRAGERVGVAVSGGIDSVVLLRLLIELRQELGIVLCVVHFNHKLRGAESEADQEFVAGLAHEHGLEFYSAGGDAGRLAAEEHSGVEAAARELRYGFFRELLGSGESAGGFGTSGAKAPYIQAAYRSAESAAPPKGIAVPQSIPPGLKPESCVEPFGAAEAAPFQRQNPQRPLELQRPLEPQRVLDQRGVLDKIVTGHTLDDQAETVLMRVIRGTGLRGLGGIYPRIIVEHEDGESYGEIVRPLLGVRRRELEQYLVDLRQTWREDSSNADSKFTRNRLRKLVLPLLEREFNPAVVEGLSELAEIARDEEDYWENEASGWLGTVVQLEEPGPQLVQILPLGPMPESGESVENVSGAETPCEAGDTAHLHGVPRFARDDRGAGDDKGARDDTSVGNISISLPWLLTEPRAVGRRVLKAVGEQVGIPLEFKHIEEILRFAAEDGPAGKELSLPLGWKIRREPEAMVFLTPDLRRQERILDYEYPLAVPGRAFVPEVGGVIEALLVTAERAQESQLAEYNPQQLLRAELLCAGLMSGRLVVRNWRPGDRFWPAHTKAPKKVKELLQERHVAQPERRLWPVVVCGEEIVWMRGFPVPAKFAAKAGQEAVLIREVESW